MHLTVIGTGYVGLSTTTCFAELGHTVCGVDVDMRKLRLLKRGRCPIFEPELEALLKKNLKKKRLFFTNDYKRALAKAQIIFLAVGTPDYKGKTDLRFLKNAATTVGKTLSKLPKKQQFYRIIVNKSTVPVGTGDLVRQLIACEYKGEFDVASNPEFLREGQAVHDTFHPDRIIIGNGNARARMFLKQLYSSFTCPLLFTDLKTAEMVKYASNTYLATSISFINSLAGLCEKIGVDVTQVAEGMRLDKRIGKQAFLDAGCGYGGSCLPKDVKALIRLGKEQKQRLDIVEATDRVNEMQKKSILQKLKKIVGPLRGKTIAVWGLSFKEGTDDIRESVTIPVIAALLKSGARVQSYDPQAMPAMKKLFPRLRIAKNPLDAAKNASVLTILTPWEVFRHVDFVKLARTMKQQIILDGRNFFSPQELRNRGFLYFSIGRP